MENFRIRDDGFGPAIAEAQERGRRVRALLAERMAAENEGYGARATVFAKEAEKILIMEKKKKILEEKIERREAEKRELEAEGDIEGVAEISQSLHPKYRETKILSKEIDSIISKTTDEVYSELSGTDSIGGRLLTAIPNARKIRELRLLVHHLQQQMSHLECAFRRPLLKLVDSESESQKIQRDETIKALEALDTRQLERLSPNVHEEMQRTIRNLEKADPTKGFQVDEAIKALKNRQDKIYLDLRKSVEGAIDRSKPYAERQIQKRLAAREVVF